MGRGSQRRLTNLSKNLGLATSSLLLILFALEVILRHLVPANPSGTTYGRPINLNSEGLRNEEVPATKAPGERRILVLGDSFTWGVGLDADETIPERLEAQLADRGYEIEVINAARPGDNTVEQLQMLQDVGPRYRPEYVLVIYNLNDIEYRPELAPHLAGERPPPTEAATPIVEIDPGETITRYSKNSGMRGLVLGAERRSILVRFLVPRAGSLLRRAGLLESVEFSWVQKLYQGFTDENPGWRESKRALREMTGICHRLGCDVIVAIYPLLVELGDYAGTEAHAAVAKHVRSLGLECVDLLPVFKNTRAASHWINVLDSHPDADAHEAVAEMLLPVVAARLEGSPIEHGEP